MWRVYKIHRLGLVMSDSDSTYQAFMEGFKGTIQPISLEAGDLKKKPATQIIKSRHKLWGPKF